MLNQVAEHLLLPHDLDDNTLARLLGQVCTHQVDYADFYFQGSIHESWVLEDGIVKDGSYNIDQGVGVRAISGEKTGFAYSDEISLLALEQAVTAARGIARSGGEGQVQAWQRQQAVSRYIALDPLGSIPRQQKIALLEQMDRFARTLDPAVTQVIASLSGVYEQVLVAGSDGTLAADIRPLVRLNCSVLVERNGRRERGGAGGGGRFGYDYFFEPQGDEIRALVMCVRRYARRW